MTRRKEGEPVCLGRLGRKGAVDCAIVWAAAIPPRRRHPCLSKSVVRHKLKGNGTHHEELRSINQQKEGRHNEWNGRERSLHMATLVGKRHTAFLEARRLGKPPTPQNRVHSLLPCLQLLLDLQGAGGPGSLAKAEWLRSEMEESRARVEAMYVAALEEARREKGEQRRHTAGRKKSNKKRGGKKVKKKQIKKAQGTGKGAALPDDNAGKEEGVELLLEGLLLDEGREQEIDVEEGDEEEVCAICLGPMDEEEEDPDDVVCRLQCSHDFHGGCVEGWTSTCNRKGLPLTCPTCRRPLQSA